MNLSFLTGFALLASLPLAAAAAARQTDRPNIIFILTDDHGYNDIESADLFDEVKMPHLHRLDEGGVRFTSGHVTAPQCSPSRAGLITGTYQQRFGLNANGDQPIPHDWLTIPDRLKAAGYVTGMVGKWHLSPNSGSLAWLSANGYPTIQDVPDAVLALYQPGNLGFDEFASGISQNYLSNFDIHGQSVATGTIDYGEYEGGRHTGLFRIEIQTQLAKAFIRRRAGDDAPFFLYLAYYGPHIPLSDVTDRYLDRFPKEYPHIRPELQGHRRRGLAILSAIDDGIGEILELLETNALLENTIIFFLGDNGAPHKTDVLRWDGSLNDPWIGYKNQVLEGGLRVPFLVYWKDHLKRGVIRQPVISLDAGATAVALAGEELDAGLDGVDLMPYLSGERGGFPHEYLYFRFYNTSAVIRREWKYVRDSWGNEALFDFASRDHELLDLIHCEPELADQLETELIEWLGDLEPEGELTDQPGAPIDNLLEYFGTVNADCTDIASAWNYCTSSGATIGFSGSVSVALDDFVLEATGLPNDSCLFAVGLNEAPNPLPFSTGGLQCVLMPCRLNPPVLASGGSVSRFVPIAEYVTHGCQMPTAGATFFYQCFFRSGAGTDTTDGLAVTFEG